MKIADRFLGVPEQLTIPETTPHYQEAKTGLQRTGVGLAAAVGGLAFNALTGSDAGIDVAAAGTMVLTWGGGELSWHSDRPKQEIHDIIKA